MNTFFGKTAIAVAVIAAAFSAVSCADSVPDIRSSDVQILRVQDESGAFAERLSLFVFFDDADGPADFGAITLQHDETGLLWTIRPDQASVRLRGKDRWTGSNSLAGPGGNAFPEGSYTCTVQDLAGNERSARFSLVQPDFPDRAPVSFSVSGSKWLIERHSQSSGFNRIFLLLFDPSGKLLQSWRVPETDGLRSEGTIQNLRSLAKDATTVQCLVQNRSGTAGVLLYPAKIE